MAHQYLWLCTILSPFDAGSWRTHASAGNADLDVRALGPEAATSLLRQPIIANGIALSKIHHAAFDNHLIGIDPDGRVHVSERLLTLHDGPLLEQSLKAAAGALIRLPRSEQHHPDRDRLAIRFERFKRAA